MTTIPALRELSLFDFLRAKKQDKVPGFALGYAEPARPDKRITLISWLATRKRLAHEYGHAALGLGHESVWAFDLMSPYPFFSCRDKHGVMQKSATWRGEVGGA